MEYEAIFEFIKIAIPAITTAVLGVIIGSRNERKKYKRDYYMSRLQEFYKPLYTILQNNHTLYGAHYFSDLPHESKENIVKLLNEKIAYTLPETSKRIYEFQSSLKHGMTDDSIQTFIELEKNIYDSYALLNKKLW
ncbi:MAG: hypothetical protein IJX07_06150 [Bacillales bacterium]|nr:hypothetical protein [Bacillales bacterium]